MLSRDTQMPKTRPVALVVDDDPSIRRLCRQMLESDGWSVHEACDGAEAIASSKCHDPDIIIMDVVMPNVDGLEATRRIRSEPTTADIPIIIISAMDAAADVIKGLEAGADEYVTKPLNPREFAVRVRSMSRLRRASRDLERGYEMLGEHSRAMNLLTEFCSVLAQTQELDAILDKTIEVAASLLQCRRVSIMLPDAAGRRLRIARSIGLDEDRVAQASVPVGEAISGRVFASGRAVVCGTCEEADALGGEGDFHVFADLSDRPVPMASVAMCAAEKAVGVLNLTDRVVHEPFGEHEIEYLKLICDYAAAAIQNVRSSEARDDARDAIVVALAKLAEHRDSETGKHVERVTAFCLLLAEELRCRPAFEAVIDAAFLRNLQRSAVLHDIGKVAIPDSILLKPGKLTREEMGIMRTHAAIGAETIRSVIVRCPDSGFLKMAQEIAAGHHERFDGSGYPDCVGGTDIPLSARILALADVYDALTTRRVYKEAMSHEEALDIILPQSGKQFDPDVVDAFRQCAGAFQHLAQELSDPATDKTVSAVPVTLRVCCD